MSNSTSRSVLAVAVHLALGSSLSAVAAEPGESALTPTSPSTPASSTETQLGKISVDAAVGEYKVDQAQSPKYTEPLRDTAQTVTVIPAELIQQQGTLLLRDDPQPHTRGAC
jgi:catecholate siderophore receptor